MKYSYDLKKVENKVILITGGTSGIGFEAVKALANNKANILLAARNETKANNCIAQIKTEFPEAKITFIKLDISSKKSIYEFYESFKLLNINIDSLILNAGVFNIPTHEITEDGFEFQLATNYLGHFLLTKLLYKHINEYGRIIQLSSLSHTWHDIQLDNINLIDEYTPIKAYAQSKLANLIFGLELARRLSNVNSTIKSIPVHPGVSNTGLTRSGDRTNKLSQKLYKLGFMIGGQSAKAGALPILFAVTSDVAENGVYYGPSHLMESRGKPKPAKIGKLAKSEEKARALWALTEELLDVKFEV